MNLLDALCRDWVAFASRDFEPRCCIAAACMGSEALRYFGVPAEPVAADVVLFNARGWDLQQAGIPTSEWPPEAWSLGVQHETNVAQGMPGPKGYPGHLVIIVHDLLIDLSAAQFNRPARNLRCDRPLILDGGTWDDAAGAMSFGATLPDGSKIAYWLRPEIRSWRASPDARRKSLAGAMIRRIREMDLTEEPQPQGAPE